MGFSEKMRESLGAEGTRLELRSTAEPLAAGGTGTIELVVLGGTKPAHVHGVILRVVEADRFWVTDDGARVAEEHVGSLDDRRGLTAAWDRRTMATRRIEVDRDVDPGERFEIALDVQIPGECRPTSVSCSHTLNVQADIKGQIDPTANIRVTIGATPATSTVAPSDEAPDETPAETPDDGPVDHSVEAPAEA